MCGSAHTFGCSYQARTEIRLSAFGRKRTLEIGDFGVSERPLWRKADIRGGEGAKLAELSYRRRMRVGSVGTAQITPPLPNEEWAPLCGPFPFGNEQVLNLASREAAQVPVEAGMAGRHN